MNIALVIIVAVALIAIAVIISYNRFVSQRQLIRNSWSNVDTELQRRHDLIPNLVETVKGYAKHEAATLEAVITARNRAVAAGGDATSQNQAQTAVVSGLRQLFAVSEAYPNLQANISFLQLQDELVTTENRIQAARRLYNGNVRTFNERVQSFPSSLIAKLGKFTAADYFEVEPSIRAAGAPSVSFQ